MPYIPQKLPRKHNVLFLNTPAPLTSMNKNASVAHENIFRTGILLRLGKDHFLHWQLVVFHFIFHSIAFAIVASFMVVFQLRIVADTPNF